MKITMLGTGHAMVTKCYNTCFVMSENNKHFLVDAGGGNQILTRLEQAGISPLEIKDVFVTHKHIDHLLGIIWLIRFYCQKINSGEFKDTVTIYSHKEVIDIISVLCKELLIEKQQNQLRGHIILDVLHDGDNRNVLGKTITFFDIQSKKDMQYGFCLEFADGEKIVCCGDEPYRENEYKYVANAKWLLHEAFCLYSEREKFKPYEKAHSTVKDACEVANKFNVKNILLYHMEDDNLSDRKRLYTEEGKKYFSGNIFVLDDLEVITC